MIVRSTRSGGATAACFVLALAACRPALRDPATLRPADDGAPDGLADGAAADSPPADGPLTADALDAPCTPLVFAAVADAYVDAGEPSRNFGDDDVVDIDSDQPGYLRFEVTGVSGPVTNALLRILVKSATEDGPEIYTTSTSWEESGITWENRPAPAGAPLRDLDAVGTGWQELDLGAALTGDGEIAFVLVPTSSDGLTFSSRETTDGPQLLLGIGCTLTAGDAAP